MNCIIERTAGFLNSAVPRLEGAVAHATRGRNRRQEGRECGYYHLHRNLDDSLFHSLPPSLLN